MYHILIADDEVIEKKVLFKTLDKNFQDQCVIFQAENGREALELFEEEDIQIAILDIEMPGINGIEVAEEIRRRKSDCCIIFLTAYDDFAYAKKAITIRALDYLLKPYEEKELISVVQEGMRLADQTKEILPPEEIVSQEVQDEVEEVGQARLSKVEERIKSFIRENYVRDISLQDAARVMNYSDAYFCKLFKQCFRKNFTTYLTEYRIREAKTLLEQPEINIKEVGELVGYSDSNYFTKVFKRITGHSPTEYRSVIFKQK